MVIFLLLKPIRSSDLSRASADISGTKHVEIYLWCHGKYLADVGFPLLTSVFAHFFSFLLGDAIVPER